MTSRPHYSKRDGYGFESGQIVWTPLRRRAILRRYHEETGRWDADYVQATKGVDSIDPTTLDPKYLKAAE
jgi:hypothetical protein